MSTDKGYIKIYRDIWDHWVWSDGEVLKAWIDLIMMANHEDRKIYFNGKVVIVKRGSFITSIRKLAKRWEWSRNRVMHLLDMLERDSMITTKRDTQKTLVTIENYGFYQSTKKQNGTRTEPRTRTRTEPQTEPQTQHKQYTIEGTIEGIGRKDCPPDEVGNPWDEEGWE